MTKLISLRLSVTLLVAFGLLVAGCGSSKSASGTSTSMNDGSGMTMTEGQTMTDGSSNTASFDRAFIDAMVPHHRSAIEMAKAAQAAGLMHPVLMKIARNIVTSQQAEIDKMLAWRKAWYGSSTLSSDTSALGMSQTEMGMMGKASALDKAKDVDATFASMMSAHHKGAIAMANMALDKAEHPQIKTLARQIIAAQKRELGEMKPYAHSSSMSGMNTG